MARTRKISLAKDDPAPPANDDVAVDNVETDEPTSDTFTEVASEEALSPTYEDGTISDEVTALATAAVISGEQTSIAPIVAPSDREEVKETLSEDEKARLFDLERKVREGLTAFHEMVVALSEIRDKRLYRESYKTFEEYCAVVFGFTDRYVRYLVNAGQVVEAVQQSEQTVPVLPTSEYQTRPLARFEAPDVKARIWREAVDRTGGRHPSFRDVKRVADEYQGDGVTVREAKAFEAGDYVRIGQNVRKELSNVRGFWAFVEEADHESVTITHAYGTSVALPDEIEHGERTINKLSPDYASRKGLLHDLTLIREHTLREQFLTVILRYFGTLEGRKVTRLEQKVLTRLKQGVTNVQED